MILMAMMNGPHDVTAVVALIFGFLACSANGALVKPPVHLGEFEGKPGGRGNIAEFGKALRLPFLAEKNHVRFEKVGEDYVHRFIFTNNTRTLGFPFRLGEILNMTIQGKVMEYLYNLETSPSQDRAVIFARYDEMNSRSRVKFTVEASFTRSGMTTTYTHADVLDNIMARRHYRRVIPANILGYYENIPEEQSANFDRIAALFPKPAGTSYSKNDAVQYQLRDSSFVVTYFMEPEIFHLDYPMKIGMSQKANIAGRNFTYQYDVGLVDRNTIIQATIRSDIGDFEGEMEAVGNGDNLNVTYQAGGIVATRKYRRALPPILFGSYVSVHEAGFNFTEYSSVFRMRTPNEINLHAIFVQPVSVCAVKLGANEAVGDEHPITIRIERADRNNYIHRVYHIFGGTETVNMTYQLGQTTPVVIGGRQYNVTYTYDGHTEHPTLNIHYDNIGGDLSFVANYTADEAGLNANYKRVTADGTVVNAHRTFRRLLPAIILGKFQSGESSRDFEKFANGIFFTELKAPTTMEFLEKDGQYVQTFDYGNGVNTTFREVPFKLGEKAEQLVKDRWLMEYVYSVVEGRRTYLRSTFTEKVNGTAAKTFGEFSRIGEFTPEGYTSTYIFKDTTAIRKYRRITPYQPSDL